MREVAISCSDELMDEIEKLNIDGVQYSRILYDDISTLDQIIAYINLGAGVFAFLGALLPLIANKTKDKKDSEKPTVIIRVTEIDYDTEKLITRYKEEVKIIPLIFEKKED